MATDLDTQQPAKPVTHVGRALLGHGDRRLLIFRQNVVTAWAFLSLRRADRRFPVQPYDAFQVANAAAVTFTALVLLVILFDPYLTLWRTGLPEPVIGFFRFFTQFGKSDWILIATGGAVIIGLFLDAGALSARERANRSVRLFAAAYVFIAVALAGIIANLSKYTIGRARPGLFDTNGSFAFDFWSWEPNWASFPSGHATTGLALGVSLALLFPRLRPVDRGKPRLRRRALPLRHAGRRAARRHHGLAPGARLRAAAPHLRLRRGRQGGAPHWRLRALGANRAARDEEIELRRPRPYRPAPCRARACRGRAAPLPPAAPRCPSSGAGSPAA